MIPSHGDNAGVHLSALYWSAPTPEQPGIKYDGSLTRAGAQSIPSRDPDVADPFEPGDRPVGEAQAIAVARVEHLVNDLQQPVVDQPRVVHCARLLQVICRDLVG